MVHNFVKKTRSFYCTESEYQRLKNVLALIRIYDYLGPSGFSGMSFSEEAFWEIVKGNDKHD